MFAYVSWRELLLKTLGSLNFLIKIFPSHGILGFQSTCVAFIVCLKPHSTHNRPQIWQLITPPRFTRSTLVNRPRQKRFRNSINNTSHVDNKYYRTPLTITTLNVAHAILCHSVFDQDILLNVCPHPYPFLTSSTFIITFLVCFSSQNPLTHN